MPRFDLKKQKERVAAFNANKQQEQQSNLEAIAAPIVKAGEENLAASGAAFSPYTEAGLAALQQQQALAGLLGPEAQQQAISMIESSPQYQAMLQQGETAILQNAAATGGLRGGNVQAALAQFRPQILSNLLEQQYGRLGGLSGMGLQATGAEMGFSSAARNEIGAAQAGVPMGQLQLKMAEDARNAQLISNILGLVGTVGGGVAGALIGGPAGAVAGAGIGGSALGSIGRGQQQAQPSLSVQKQPSGIMPSAYYNASEDYGIG